MTTKIVCLIGSTHFTDVFIKTAWELSLEGCIVLSIEICPYNIKHHAGEVLGVADKLSELHLRKIDLCSEVLVLNVGGYVGEDTKREISYARSLGKKVRWLEHNVPLWKKTLNRLRGQGSD